MILFLISWDYFIFGFCRKWTSEFHLFVNDSLIAWQGGRCDAARRLEFFLLTAFIPTANKKKQKKTYFDYNEKGDTIEYVEENFKVNF